MIAEADADRIVRAWVAPALDVIPTTWPSGAYFVGPGSSRDYFVFVVSDPRNLRVGASYYVAVHHGSGEIYDLGFVGE